MIAVGGSIALIFLILFLASCIASLPESPGALWIMRAVFGLFTAASGMITGWGIKLLKQVGRFKNYSRRIAGREYCNISEIGSNSGKSIKFVTKDLERMISKGWFRQGHMDGEKKCLILSNRAYEEYLQIETRRQQSKAEEPVKKEEKTQENTKEKEAKNEKQEPTKQEIALQSIGLNQTSLKMWVGGSETLEVTCTPSNTTVDKTITWKSSNEKVATVKDGKVEAVGEGEVVITAEVAGKKASCTVNAKQYYRLFWEGYMNFLPVGSHGTIWIGDPDNLSAPYYHVYSLNEDIATTDNDGNLTGVSEGTATIVVEGDGKKGSIDIEVKKPAEFETAYLDQDVYTMKTGDKLQLHATVVPENALIEKRYYWGSKNPEVAEIDSEGVVRAMGIGEAEIICSLREIPLTSDGHDGSIFHYVTCKIKVDSVGTNTEFEDFKWELTDINNKGEYVKVGDIITPNIKVYPVTYPYNLKDVKFSIEKSEQEGSEEGIVEITDENKIKICKPGVAYIKAVLNGKEARMRFVCE